jgi:hypothetical protein
MKYFRNCSEAFAVVNTQPQKPDTIDAETGRQEGNNTALQPQIVMENAIISDGKFKNRRKPQYIPQPDGQNRIWEVEQMKRAK